MTPKNSKRDPVEAKSVKKCIPFLDALTIGYIIPFPIDMLVYYDKFRRRMNWEYKAGMPKEYEDITNIGTHSDGQVYESLVPKEATWKHPFNNRRPYKLIDGIVDTDTFPLHINFPFYWTADLKEEVLLKKGDPMVQVIPFKREEWQQETISEDFDKRHYLKLRSKIDDSYKTQWWEKKSYK